MLRYIDTKHKRNEHTNPFVSFVIPCYNDSKTVRAAIESVFKSYDQNRFELIVVNDGSTDNSAEIIRGLQSEYDFVFLDLAINKGKADALNSAIRKTKYEIISSIDADTLLNAHALDDALRRLEEDKKIALVSCPYIPSNMGNFWTHMQEIEYVMLKFMQGSYNCVSTLAAWGGCLVLKKQAFEEVGGFELSAITEDMYLALDMGASGWKAQQSYCAVESEVPDTYHKRLKQKIRRCSGGAQAFFSHIPVWIKNPFHMICMLSFGLLGAVWMLHIIRYVYHMGEIAYTTGSASFLIDDIWNIAFNSLGYMVGSMFLSLPYVLYIIKSIKQWTKVRWIFPYILFYVNVYAFVSLYGFLLGIYKLATLKKGIRGR